MHIAIVMFMTVFLMTADRVYPGEKVVAVVGSSEIAEAELESAIDNYVPQGAFHSGMSRQKRDKYRKPALEWLIQRELLYQEAVRRGMKVTDREVADVIEENRKKFASDSAFNAALERQGMSSEQLRKRIVRENLIRKLVLKEIEEKSVLSDDEVRSYYEKNIERFRKPDSLRLWHILISVPANAPAQERVERRAFASEVLAKLKGGEDFSMVAAEYSDDEYRVKGGDLGYIHRGRLFSDAEDAAFRLKEGELSDVVESIYGFHIMKAGERRPSGIVSYEDVKNRLKTELEKKRYDERMEAFIQKLKEKTTVVVYDE